MRRNGDGGGVVVAIFEREQAVLLAKALARLPEDYREVIVLHHLEDLNFPEVARRMRERRNGRPPYRLENEFDIQDLLYVALKPHIPDLSEEEWTPKHAGRAKRIDFISDGSRICLESKKVRDESHGKRIADELKIDIESYYVHKACDKLIAFVYDPSGYMVDAHQQELQLSGERTIKGRTIEVIVRIRPR